MRQSYRWFSPPCHTFVLFPPLLCAICISCNTPTPKQYQCLQRNRVQGENLWNDDAFTKGKIDKFYKRDAHLRGWGELCGSQWRKRVWSGRRRTCGGGWTPGVRFPIRTLWVEQGQHQSTCPENSTHSVNTGKWRTHTHTRYTKDMNATPC